jgi:D-alanyl-D-alanine carboxypeptidase/D-alanyl-D-alanine-endopeptidase (penicillin-binding protein 4)
MAHSPYRDAFYNAQPAPGEEGTLTNRSRGPLDSVPPNVRAKTGAMTHVRNLSGYLTTKSGELLAFSFLCNNHNLPNAVVDNLFDRLLDRLNRFSAAGSD